MSPPQVTLAVRAKSCWGAVACPALSCGLSPRLGAWEPLVNPFQGTIKLCGFFLLCNSVLLPWPLHTRSKGCQSLLLPEMAASARLWSLLSPSRCQGQQCQTLRCCNLSLTWTQCLQPLARPCPSSFALLCSTDCPSAGAAPVAHAQAPAPGQLAPPLGFSFLFPAPAGCTYRALWLPVCRLCCFCFWSASRLQVDPGSLPASSGG